MTTITGDNVRSDCEEGRGDYKEERSVLQREMREWRQGLRAKYAAEELPEHFRGYEALLEEDQAPTAPIPTGTACQLLMHIHIHVYTVFRHKNGKNSDVILNS